MPKLYWNIDQGSADWYKLRARIPTASQFHRIITPKKLKLSETRQRYQCEIIAARMLNWQADSLDKIENIQAGRELEPLAIGMMETLHGIETRRIGFVTTDDGRWGASPDRVMMRGDQIAVTAEAKCPTIPVQFERLLFGYDDEYKCQIQGQLFVTEADKALFYSFNPRMPPFDIEIGRDETMIGQMRAALEQFSDELAALDERARSLGAYEAFAEILTPQQVATEEEVEALVHADYSWGG